MRADDHDGVADGGSDRLCQIFAEHDGRLRGAANGGARRRGLKRLERTGRRVCHQIADPTFVLGQDAFDQSTAVACAACHQDLLVETGRGGHNVRNLAQTLEQRPPVAYALRACLHELYVGRGVYQAILQVALHAVGDGECDDQRGNTGSHTGNRNACDHTDYGLTAFGAQIACGKKEFEAHFTLPPWVQRFDRGPRSRGGHRRAL